MLFNEKRKNEFESGAIKNKGALNFCQQTAKGFKLKSDHNKKESLRCFVIVMLATLITPLFITLANDFWLGKVVPATLSALAAFCTAWLQLRKPQQLWALYRECQRRIEDHETRYIYKISPYDSSDSDQILANSVAKIAMEAHDKWIPLVPSPESLTQINDKRTNV